MTHYHDFWAVKTANCGEPVPGRGLERVAKGRTGRDTELGKGLVQVTADGPVRQEQPLPNLLVSQAHCRETDDLELLVQRRLVDAFIGAAQRGDVAGLEGLFASDVVSASACAVAA